MTWKYENTAGLSLNREERSTQSFARSLCELCVLRFFAVKQETRRLNQLFVQNEKRKQHQKTSEYFLQIVA